MKPQITFFRYRIYIKRDVLLHLLKKLPEYNNNSTNINKCEND